LLITYFEIPKKKQLAIMATRKQAKENMCIAIYIFFFLVSGSYCPEYDEVPFYLRSTLISGGMFASYPTLQKVVVWRSSGYERGNLAQFSKREYVYCHLYIYILLYHNK
jgi:hypothetical protein